MKRPAFILLGGLVLALLAYGGSFWAGSARSRCLRTGAVPELAWLQQEFQLSDAELARVQKLHDSYLAGCAERCRRIDARNAELRRLLSATNAVTTEIEDTLVEAARLRTDCHREMLRHFYQISQSMPPAQGRRYLDWVVSRTFGSEHDSMMSAPAAAAHEHPHQ